MEAEVVEREREMEMGREGQRERSWDLKMLVLKMEQEM